MLRWSLVWLLAVGPAGHVDVDASAIETVGPELAAQTQERLDVLLTEEGIEPSSLRVRIEWFDVDNFHYAVKATLDPDLPSDQLPIIETCEGCSTTAVAEAAVKGVKALIRERPPAPVREEITTAPTPPKTVDEPRAKLAAAGWTGIGLLAAGAATAITGGVFLGIGETRPPQHMDQVRNFRPTGYGLLATGGALLIVGAVLLAVDRAQAKKGRRRVSFNIPATPVPWGR